MVIFFFFLSDLSLSESCGIVLVSVFGIQEYTGRDMKPNFATEDGGITDFTVERFPSFVVYLLQKVSSGLL